MNFRDKLNEYPQAGVAAAAVVVLGAILLCWHQVVSGNRIQGISDKGYFTTDETLTGQAAVNALFSAPVSNVPPFDYNGKTAVRAKCFCCNGGRSVWVQYLYRFTPKVREKVVDAYTDEVAKGNHLDPDMTPFIESGMEVKAPGNGPWVRFKDPTFQGITHITPPPGVPSDDTTFYVP